jgi:hypothetical protein
MTTRDLLARCRTLGIALAAASDGALTWEADTDPPAELLAELREHKAELLALLSTPAGVPTGPAPSPAAQLFFADETGRPCSAGDAYLWTWSGALEWFYTSRDPVPCRRQSST